MGKPLERDEKKEEEVFQPPRITRDPQSKSAVLGARVDLRVQAIGTPRPSYQWLQNGQKVPGGNGPMLLIPRLQRNQAGQYVCEVTNKAGSVQSRMATISVKEESKTEDEAKPPLPPPLPNANSESLLDALEIDENSVFTPPVPQPTPAPESDEFEEFIPDEPSLAAIETEKENSEADGGFFTFEAETESESEPSNASDVSEKLQLLLQKIQNYRPHLAPALKNASPQFPNKSGSDWTEFLHELKKRVA